jgi:hypothetical protein
MTQEDMDKIIQLIEHRKGEVLSANNVEEGDVQYAWIDGIYNDIVEYIKVQFN